jgi:hypothetical protein
VFKLVTIYELFILMRVEVVHQMTQPNCRAQLGLAAVVVALQPWVFEVTVASQMNLYRKWLPLQTAVATQKSVPGHLLREF